jgi:hypothetical protein
MAATLLGFTNRGAAKILEVYTGAGTYKMALCAKQNQKTINAGPAVNKGGGKVGVPVTAHGYSTGNGVKIIGTTNYDGYWIVDATSSTNEVVIVVTYVAETFTGSQTIHRAPGPDTNVLTDLIQIAAGNGYTAGGQTISAFDTLTEDDTVDQGRIQCADVVWTASGGAIPSSGDGIRYAVMLDSSNNVICAWDFEADITISAGQQFTIEDAELIGEPQ